MNGDYTMEYHKYDKYQSADYLIGNLIYTDIYDGSYPFTINAETIKPFKNFIDNMVKSVGSYNNSGLVHINKLLDNYGVLGRVLQDLEFTTEQISLRKVTSRMRKMQLDDIKKKCILDNAYVLFKNIIIGAFNNKHAWEIYVELNHWGYIRDEILLAISKNKNNLMDESYSALFKLERIMDYLVYPDEILEPWFEYFKRLKLKIG